MLADILGYVTKEPTSIGSLKVDIVEIVSYAYEQEAPRHPVEKGYEINDTIINKPLKFDMKVGVSSHPITWFYKNGRGVKKFSDGVKALMAIRDAKMPVTIVRPNDILNDMVMTSCKYSYTKESKTVMIVELAFVKIVKVDTATVAIPQDIVDKSIKDNAGETAKSGGQATQSTQSGDTASGNSSGGDSASGNTEKSKTILKTGKDGISNVVDGLKSWFKKG